MGRPFRLHLERESYALILYSMQYTEESLLEGTCKKTQALNGVQTIHLGPSIKE